MRSSPALADRRPRSGASNSGLLRTSRCDDCDAPAAPRCSTAAREARLHRPRRARTLPRPRRAACNAARAERAEQRARSTRPPPADGARHRQPTPRRLPARIALRCRRGARARTSQGRGAPQTMSPAPGRQASTKPPRTARSSQRLSAAEIEELFARLGGAQSHADHRTGIQHAVRTAGRGDAVGAGHRRRRQQGHAQAVPGRQHARGRSPRWAWRA